MSIVRYVNKKSGRVALYESTSHYDPVTKQSRPKRKYLGTEDPETGELIPSSGKRGRKKKTDGTLSSENRINEDGYKQKYEQMLQKLKEKDAKIRLLESENQRLLRGLKKLEGLLSGILEGK